MVIWCSWQSGRWVPWKRGRRSCRRSLSEGKLSMFRSGEYSITTGQWPEYKPEIVLPLHRASSSLAWLLSVSLYSVHHPTQPQPAARALVRSAVAATPDCLQLQMFASTSCFPLRGSSFRFNQTIRFLDPVRFFDWLDFPLWRVRSKPLLKRMRMTRTVLLRRVSFFIDLHGRLCD